jgi:hypothetical protein
MTDAELSVVKCRTMFITRRSSILYRRSLNQTTNHSKPILIPLLYHTRGGTLKMSIQQILYDLAWSCPRDANAYIKWTHPTWDPPPHSMLMMTRRPEFLMCAALPRPSSALPPLLLRPSSASKIRIDRPLYYYLQCICFIMCNLENCCILHL